MRPIHGDFKGMPPVGFGINNRSREDMLKGALLLLRDHGPATSTEILFTQETTSQQVRQIIAFLKKYRLITVMQGIDDTNDRLPNQGMHFITKRGKKYLAIMLEMDELMPKRPTDKSRWHAGDRGISPKDRGRAMRLRHQERERLRP